MLELFESTRAHTDEDAFIRGVARLLQCSQLSLRMLQLGNDGSEDVGAASIVSASWREPTENGRNYSQARFRVLLPLMQRLSRRTSKCRIGSILAQPSGSPIPPQSVCGS
jgi:hypothetical protein